MRLAVVAFSGLLRYLRGPLHILALLRDKTKGLFMFSAYIVPTEYDQPKPIDGEYAATVFQTYAEFEYQGRKVIAKATNQALMNVDGNSGKVIVSGYNADITWIGSAPYKPFEHPRKVERETSFETSLTATLVPHEFEQPNPFAYSSVGFRSRARSINVEFGTTHKYDAILDDHVRLAVLDAPCTIKPLEGHPMKCLVVFEDATIFLAKRYGRDVHEVLVEKAVNELQRLLSKQ